MDDRQAWHLGNERLEGLLASLPEGTGSALRQLLTRYQKIKEALAAVVSEVDAASDCYACGGECCLNGKYRVNVFDALSGIATGIPISADFAQKPVCPYGTIAGCTMEPRLRPADCILFICTAIDMKLSPHAGMLLVAQEQLLRECIHEASCLTGEPLGTPLLLWATNNAPTTKINV